MKDARRVVFYMKLTETFLNALLSKIATQYKIKLQYNTENFQAVPETNLTENLNVSR